MNWMLRQMPRQWWDSHGHICDAVEVSVVYWFLESRSGKLQEDRDRWKLMSLETKDGQGTFGPMLVSCARSNDVHTMRSGSHFKIVAGTTKVFRLPGGSVSYCFVTRSCNSLQPQFFSLVFGNMGLCKSRLSTWNPPGAGHLQEQQLLPYPTWLPDVEGDRCQSWEVS